MMKEPQPPPPWLDLGPLESVQVGSTVCTVRIKDDRVHVSPGVLRVRACEDWRNLVESAAGKPLGGWVKKFGGACSSMGGTYYYSANPKHITTSRTMERALKRKHDEQVQERERRMELAKEAGEILGDGWREPSDDGWHSSAIADELVSRLTDMQIRQLTAWLKGGDSVV